jgi:hypothetical protein
MSRKEYKSGRRKTVSSVETLDDRVLLAVAVPAPATPPPAPSPVNMAMVERFEHKLERIDREFVAHSKQLKTSLIRKTDQLEAQLTSLAKRPQVQAQLVTNAPGATAPVSLVTQTQAVSNQLNQVVASFNSRLTQLSNSFEQQFGVFANPLEQADARATIPASAFENHLQSARAGLTASVASAVRSVVTLQSPTSTASNSATSSTTTTTGTTASTATTIGVTATQDFSNASTLAFAPLNSAINSVDSTLSGIFGAFQTQFQTNVTSLITGISTTPAGAFQPTTSFVSGNGVTFTSTG